MKFIDKLKKNILRTSSTLCVGLDPRISKGQSVNDIENFLFTVIKETSYFAAAYKPNSAYFEAMGWEGMKLLEKLRSLIPQEIPIILDCKRSDIGETQKHYAIAAIDIIKADAVTLNPWLGFDSLLPFLERDIGVYILLITSNSGAKDIQLQKLKNNLFVNSLALNFLEKAKNYPANLGFVVGLTQLTKGLKKDSDFLRRAPILFPGLGSQGGSLSNLKGIESNFPFLVNVSRGILYENTEESFSNKAKKYAQQISEFIIKNN